MRPSITSQNGLLNKSTFSCITIKSMHVHVGIVDVVTEVSWTQKYVNNDNTSVEALYSLLLPLNTAITSFVVTTDKGKVKGVVKENEEASNTYDDAIASGGNAFLVEKTNSTDVNEFKISVGNLQPKQEVQIQLDFIAPTIDADGKQVFRLPLELIPKNISNLSISCTIESSIPLKCITTSHGQLSSNSSITWSGSSLISDFTVTMEPDTNPEPKGILEIDPENPKSKSLMIVHYPWFVESELNFVEPKMEVIFLVDRSGSMAGDRINKTRTALNVLIHSIPSDSKFNIVGFGSSQEWLFPESVTYSEVYLKQAEALILKMEANLGGTNLLTPFQKIFSKPIHPEYPRLVIVLTDGDVDNREDTIAEVKRHSDECRVFGLGIGMGVDMALVNGISAAGRGRAEFVVQSADIEARVMKLFKYALVPCFSKIQVIWDNDTVQQSPFTIPSIINGSRMTVYALIESDNDFPFSSPLTITYNDPENNNQKWTVPLTIRKGNTIQKMAAFSLIRDLQEEHSPYHANNPPPSTLAETVKKEIIKLGLTYQLASKHTSFVAIVEGEETPSTGSLKIQQVILTSTPAVPHYSMRSPRGYGGSQSPGGRVGRGSQSSTSTPGGRGGRGSQSSTSTPGGRGGRGGRGSQSSTSTPEGRGGRGSQSSTSSTAFRGAFRGRGSQSSASNYKSTNDAGKSRTGWGPAYNADYGMDGGYTSSPLFQPQSIVPGTISPTSLPYSSSSTHYQPPSSRLVPATVSPTSLPYSSSYNLNQSYNQSTIPNPSRLVPATVSPTSLPSSSLFSYQSTIPKPISQTSPSVFSVPMPTTFQSSSPISSPRHSNTFQSSSPSISSPRLSNTTPESLKNKIISLQQFDGSWDLQGIVTIIGLQSLIEAQCPGLDIKIWTTALGVALLELKCASFQSSWEIVVSKARTWMLKILLRNGTEKQNAPEKVTTTIQLATEFVKKNSV